MDKALEACARRIMVGPTRESLLDVSTLALTLVGQAHFCVVNGADANASEAMIPR